MSDVVLSSRDGPVLTLTLNRPEALNALTRETTQALRTEVETAGRDPEVGAIVLTGAGRAFCAGADLKDANARALAGDNDLGADLRTNYTPMIRAIRACPKPVIAALNGTAAGAGLSLALACDLRLAAAGAQLIVIFVRVGLVPDAGSLFFLTRMLGLSKATELAITGARGVRRSTRPVDAGGDGASPSAGRRTTPDVRLDQARDGTGAPSRSRANAGTRITTAGSGRGDARRPGSDPRFSREAETGL